MLYKGQQIYTLVHKNNSLVLKKWSPTLKCDIASQKLSDAHQENVFPLLNCGKAKNYIIPLPNDHLHTLNTQLLQQSATRQSKAPRAGYSSSANLQSKCWIMNLTCQVLWFLNALWLLFRWRLEELHRSVIATKMMSFILNSADFLYDLRLFPSNHSVFSIWRLKIATHYK